MTISWKFSWPLRSSIILATETATRESQKDVGEGQLPKNKKSQRPEGAGGQESPQKSRCQALGVRPVQVGGGFVQRQNAAVEAESLRQGQPYYERSQHLEEAEGFRKSQERRWPLRRKWLNAWESGSQNGIKNQMLWRTRVNAPNTVSSPRLKRRPNRVWCPFSCFLFFFF